MRRPRAVVPRARSTPTRTSRCAGRRSPGGTPREEAAPAARSPLPRLLLRQLPRRTRSATSRSTATPSCARPARTCLRPVRRSTWRRSPQSSSSDRVRRRRASRRRSRAGWTCASTAGARSSPWCRRGSRATRSGRTARRFASRPCYSAGAAGRSVSIRDTNFASRIGWREIVVAAERGARIGARRRRRESASAALRAYPKDLLREPARRHLRAARAFAPGDAPGGRSAARRLAGPVRASSAASSAGRRDELDARLRAGLAAARAVLGRGARIQPRPRQGDRRRLPRRHARDGRATPSLLGGIVTVTHTIGVFALGLVTLALSEFIVPEQLYPWLNLRRGPARRRRRRRGRPHARPRLAARARARAEDTTTTTITATATATITTRSPVPASVAARRRDLRRDRPVPDRARRAARRDLAAPCRLRPRPDRRVQRRPRRLDHGDRPDRRHGEARVRRLGFDGPLIRALPALSALVVLVLGVAMTVRALPDLI